MTLHSQSRTPQKLLLGDVVCTSSVLIALTDSWLMLADCSLYLLNLITPSDVNAHSCVKAKLYRSLIWNQHYLFFFSAVEMFGVFLCSFLLVPLILIAHTPSIRPLDFFIPERFCLLPPLRCPADHRPIRDFLLDGELQPLHHTASACVWMCAYFSVYLFCIKSVFATLQLCSKSV